MRKRDTETKCGAGGVCVCTYLLTKRHHPHSFSMFDHLVCIISHHFLIISLSFPYHFPTRYYFLVSSMFQTPTHIFGCRVAIGALVGGFARALYLAGGREWFVDMACGVLIGPFGELRDRERAAIDALPTVRGRGWGAERGVSVESGLWYLIA